MDAESLVQIERIVSTAVSGAEERLRKDMGTLEGQLRNEIGTMEGRLRNEMGTMEGRLRSEMGTMEARLRKEIETSRQELHGRVEDAKLYAGVLHEEMCRRFDLVVEGVQTLREGQKDLRQTIEHESLETRALMQLSYRQLQERVDTLERRVLIIEKHVGLSA